MSTLLRNPTNIGDIFFSGSQSVTKGNYVAWILTETWAFKTTEECSVSMNGTPFVNLTTGQTFIIKQGARYVFDRDTVVALAYPQDVTQDIIIENDIYNNNLSTIIIESDKTPVAKIVASNSSVTVGTVVTFASNSYSPDNPPQDLTYRWLINGQDVSTAEEFTYTPQTIGTYDILLIVTDEDGRKGDDSFTLRATAVPVIDDIFFTAKQLYSASIPESTWTPIFSLTANKSSTPCQVTLNYTGGFSSTWSSNKVYLPSSAQIRLKINGVIVYSGTLNAPTNTTYQAPWFKIDEATFNNTINQGDNVVMEVYWTDANEYATFGSTTLGSVVGDLQLKYTAI